MKWTRTSATVLVAAAVVMGLSACSSTNGGAASEIEVQTGLAADSAQLNALTEITNEFIDANPDINVRLVPGSASYEQDIKVRLASKDVPDVFSTHGWSRDRYADFLEPLQDQAWAENLNPALESSMMDPDGALFALPLDTSVSGIVYNETVLGSVGVDPESLTDWGSFTDAATAVAESGKTAIAASGKDNWTAGNIADFSATGFYDESQLKELTDGKFDQEIYAQVLTQISDWGKAGMYNKDYSSATAQDVNRLLATGEAAFAFQTNGMALPVQELNPDVKLGYIPVPSKTSDGYLIGGEDYALGLSKTSDDKEDALKYLTFLAEPTSQEKMANTLGSAPGLTNATSDLGMMGPSFDKWVTDAGTPVTPYFDRVYLPNGIWNTMVTTSDAMITGQSSPADGAAQMATSFESLFGQE